MDAPLLLLLTNAAMAGLLAFIAWATSRTVRRQAVVHAVWLLALLKLVAPPVAPLRVLPAWDDLRLVTVSAAPTFVAIRPASVSPATEPAVLEPAPRSPGQTVAGGAPVPAERRAVPSLVTAPRFDARGPTWLALVLGALVVSVLSAWRFARFSRLLRCARPAPADLAERAAALAARIGLQRAPPVVLVPARVPPMLWPGRAGPRLLLPEGLVSGLGRVELDTLIAHELAHVRRRDHWVRLLEIAATTLFWWYPVTWWARASLRRAEERCCDEWVLRVLPSSGRAYANGLLKSLAFVAGEAAALPAVASGAGPVRDLEARLKEILMTRPSPRLAVPVRLALVSAAALGLAVFPTHAQSRAPEAGAPTVAPTDEREPVPAVAPAPRPVPAIRATAPALAPAPGAAPSPLAPVARPAPVTIAPALAAVQEPAPRPMAVSEQDEARRALEQKRRSLQAQRARLHQQQLELERQQLELEAGAEQEQLRAEAEKLRARGETDRAAFLEKQAEMTARRADIQRRQLELEAERVALEAQLEQTLQEKAARIQALERSGHRNQAEDLRRELERAQAEHETVSRKLRDEQGALEREMEQEAKRMEELSAQEQVMHLRQATRELARSLADQLESLRRSLDRLGPKRPEAEAEIGRLEKALSALQETARP